MILLCPSIAGSNIQFLTKKVLYISYDGMTDTLGQSQVLPYIISLIRHGYSFHLISFEKKKKYHEIGGKIKLICKEHDIQWTPLMYSKRPPVLSTLWDMRKMSKAVSKAVKLDGIELIHCRSYLPSIFALKVKRKKGIPFIFDMRGFYADERVEGDLWNLKNPLFLAVYRYLKRKERQFLEESDHCVSLTESGLNEMLTWNLNVDLKEKCSIIPCAADFKLFEVVNADKKKKSRNELGIPQDVFVLTYLGSIGTWYLFEELILFFAVLRDMKPNSKFLLITPNTADEVYAYTDRYNIARNDIVVRFAQRNEVSLFLDATDLGIFFIKPSYSKKSSSPTKMGEMLAKGIPIIANSNVGDVEQLINQYNFGFVFNELNEQSFRDNMDSVLEQTNLDAEQLRERAAGYYALERAEGQYLEIYKKILG